MREIKARAWDKDAEYMVYSDNQEDDYFFEFVDGKLQAFGIRLGPGSIDSPPQPESYELSDVMLCTGLPDKSGKEIYEGDIFKAPHDFGPGGFEWRVAVVAFHIESGYQWNFWNLEELEIIGNIWENPELSGK